MKLYSLPFFGALVAAMITGYFIAAYAQPKTVTQGDTAKAQQQYPTGLADVTETTPTVVTQATEPEQPLTHKGFTRLPFPIAPIADQEQPAPLLVPKHALETKTYRELLSQTQSKNAAYAMLNEPALNEGEVVKFLTVMGMITDGWSLARSSERSQYVDLKKHLMNAWPYYYDIIIAAECTYCGSSFNFNAQLAHSAGTPQAAALWLAPIHPRYLKLANDLANIPAPITAQLAKNFALLGDAGDSGTRDFIAEHITDTPKLLAHWHPKKLIEPILKKPIEQWSDQEKRQSIQYWENRVLNGSVDLELSIKLATGGHRPALRWLIWLLDDQADYLHKYVYQDIRPEIRSALNRISQFPPAQINDWSVFYSQHWQHISWDDTQKLWLVSTL